MKKTILTILSCVLIVAGSYAQCMGDITLSQSTDNTIITPGNSVSCNNGSGHTDNSYFRVYDLTAEGVTGDFEVTGVTMGIEAATSSTGTQPMSINLYTLTGPLMLANLTPLHTQMEMVPDQSLTIQSFTIPSVIVPAGSQLVVEVFTPNGQTTGEFFFIGSNNLGQSAPSYLAAADCGIVEPTETAVLGFPDMHVILDVVGCEVIDAPIPTMGEWGVIVLGLSFFVIGIVTLRQRRTKLA